MSCSRGLSVVKDGCGTILHTKSVFSNIILVSKIANFQHQSGIIDNKTLTSFVIYIRFFLTLSLYGEDGSISVKTWAVYYYLIGGCLAIPRNR